MDISAPFFTALVGKPVAHLWRGHGSAIFIEFGELISTTRMDGTFGPPKGELTLMIEWSWRIERPKSIYGGSWSNERRWPKMFEKLNGAKVTNVQTFGEIPEICVSFSNSLRVLSFMTADGQPEWGIITRTPNIGSLSVRRGALHVEKPTSNPSFKRDA